MLKPTNGQRRARHIYIKGVTVRFGFDLLELRTLYGKSKTKQPERLMGVSYTFLIDIGNSNVDVGNQYIHIRGAFSVARFDLQGNAKAFMRGTSDRIGSTFFCV